MSCWSYRAYSSLAASATGDLRYGGLLYTFSLLMALLPYLAIFTSPGLKVVAVGMASNFLVIAANLGQMPGALEKLEAAGYTGSTSGDWSNFKDHGWDNPPSGS